jgi:hypothetical protein
MADHASKQVIDAIAAAIVAGATDAADRVYTSQLLPVPSNALPVVVVTGGDEQIDQITVRAPHQQHRMITIDVAVHVRGLDDYDAQAYQLLMQIEHVIAAIPTAGGKARNLRPTEVRWERVADAEQPIARATLVLSADVYVLNNAVDAPLA